MSQIDLTSTFAAAFRQAITRDIAETVHYAARKKNPSLGQPSLFDTDHQQHLKDLGPGHWITIHSDHDGNGGTHGGHPVFIGEDGKMKTGAFAGQTMSEAFGTKSKQKRSTVRGGKHEHGQPGLFETEAQPTLPGIGPGNHPLDTEKPSEASKQPASDLKPAEVAEKPELTNLQKLDLLSEEDKQAMADADYRGDHDTIAKLRAKAGIDDSLPRSPRKGSAQPLGNESKPKPAEPKHGLSAVDTGSIQKMAPGAKKRMDREQKAREDGLNQAEESRKWNENFAKIAADDVSKLRKADVYRLLSEAPQERLGNFENWLIKRRPDLAEEVNEVSEELNQERQSSQEDEPAEAKPAEAAPKPGIIEPPKTVANDSAKSGDQLGLFGEAFKPEPSGKAPTLKPGGETAGKAQNLFDTHGEADQMDLFGDGVMDPSMVYQPETEKKPADKPAAKKAEKPGEKEAIQDFWVAKEAASKEAAKSTKGKDDKAGESAADKGSEPAATPKAPSLDAKKTETEDKPKRIERNPEPKAREGGKDHNGREFAPGVSYSSIPFSAGHAAHAGSSFVPDERARSHQKGFAHAMNSHYEDFKKSAGDDKAKLATLESEWPEFLSRAKGNYLAALRADSRTMSSMITGPANFPTSRNRKRLDTAQKRWDDYSQGIESGVRAVMKKMHPENAPKKIGDAETGDHIQTKLDNLRSKHATMKAANVIVNSAIDKKASTRETPAFKKGHSLESTIEKLQKVEGISETTARQLLVADFAGRYGFPSYELTNTNANIRRYEQQAAAQSKFESEAKAAESAGDGATEHEFDGGKLHLDYDDNRIRIKHDEKPPADVIAKLKSKGFRWSPANKAWQRQLTNAAKYDAHTLAGVPLDKLTPKAAASESPKSTEPDRKRDDWRAIQQGLNIDGAHKLSDGTIVSYEVNDDSRKAILTHPDGTETVKSLDDLRGNEFHKAVRKHATDYIKSKYSARHECEDWQAIQEFWLSREGTLV